MLSALNRYARTLKQIERQGVPALDERSVRRRPGGRLAVEVFPERLADRVTLNGLRAEVWMEPDVERSELSATLAPWYRRTDPPGRIALVLGAGNITSIAPLDVLYELIAHGSVCMLKINPVLEYLGPLLEEAFAPLVSAGYLRFAYGGRETGEYLCRHPLVEAIHVTGSRATYDAIAQQTRNVPITSELGNVSPAIVVPGAWSDADLQLQAEQIATAKLHNDGFNCVALQVLILPVEWDRRDALLAQVERVFEGTAQRPAYYPGAVARYEAMLAGHARVRRFGRPTDNVIPPTIVEIDPAQTGDPCFSQEAFCPLLAVVAIGGSIDAYLRKAVQFANESLAGNLAANLIAHPKTIREYAGAIDRAIADLRYGCIGVNAWSGVGFTLAPVPWGAFAGNTPGHIESGSGVVHNSRLFSRTQKSVIYAPFAPFLRPPWLITNRSQAWLARALCKFETLFR